MRANFPRDEADVKRERETIRETGGVLWWRRG